MIQIKTPRKDLRNAFDRVSAASGTTQEALDSHVVFRVQQGKVTLHTINQQIMASSPLINPDVEGDGMFTVEAKRLKQWLTAVTSDNIEIQFDKGVVVARADRGKATFPSLDPQNYPFWDSLLVDAAPAYVISQTRLVQALQYSKPYIYDQETKSPDICVTEIKGGILFATNRSALARVKLDGMGSSTLRVFGKDVPAILSFLSHAEADEDIQIREHSRAIFFTLADGSQFCESRAQKEFPTLGDMNDAALVTLRFNAEDIQKGLMFVQSAADWKDTRLTLRCDDGKVYFKMRNAAIAGSTETAVPAEVQDGSDDMKEGVTIHLPSFKSYVNAHPHKEIVISYHRAPQGRIGYFSSSFGLGVDNFMLSLVCQR